MKGLDRNILINALSFFVVALSGIAINVLIIRFYNSSVLGRYNLLYTILLIASQFSVAGVQFSVLRYTSLYSDDKSTLCRIIGSGLIVTMTIALLVISLLYFSAETISGWVSEKDFVFGFYLMLPALLFYSWNKVLLMSINGTGRMKAYAMFSALRYICLLMFVTVFYLTETDSLYLGMVFSACEILLFMTIFIYIMCVLGNPIRSKRKWIEKHMHFGIRGLWGGVLMESNTRIDILMIGTFMTDHAVGIYSFASTLAEGFAQLYTVLKNNLDPYFGKKSVVYNEIILKKLIADIRKKYVPVIILFGVFLLVLYKSVFVIIGGLTEEFVKESFPPLWVLILFICCGSVYKPFAGLMTQIGRPGVFSLVISISVLANIGLNYYLIPKLGIIGASLSTGLIFLLESASLYHISMHCVFKSNKMHNA